jgi:hypothetical protein
MHQVDFCNVFAGLPAPNFSSAKGGHFEECNAHFRFSFSKNFKMFALVLFPSYPVGMFHVWQGRHKIHPMLFLE